ncbi:MAG: hypothetical protein LRY40_07085 [Shewanella fodinae]|nr:hypothetical protein [Shewanella fodinae]
MWICRQGIGFSTHSVGNSPAMYGTQVTNVLPEKSKWAAFAVRVNNGTDAEFYSQDGHKFDASQIYGGAYDSLKRSRIIIGRGDSSQDWTKESNGSIVSCALGSDDEPYR